MRRSRYRVFDIDYPHFRTDAIVACFSGFSHPPLVDILLDSWRFRQRERGVRSLGCASFQNRLQPNASAHCRDPDAGSSAGQLEAVEMVADWR